MPASLIRVSGHIVADRANPEYAFGAKGRRFSDEPLTHSKYFNVRPYWQEDGFGRHDAW